jgi:2-amino-4-hydroxy-6-hydroxymethyldihydropteridine diphosphokinase
MVTEKAVLLLGSNIEPRVSFLKNAFSLISEKAGKPLLVSKIYESEPWGFKNNISFLNQVIVINTYVKPQTLLNICLSIEQLLGRKRTSSKGYTSRTIDIDILYYGSKIIKTNNLTIPHPLLQERKFTLMPLTEIIPEFIHPIFNTSQKKLLELCNDNSSVKIYNEKV